MKIINEAYRVLSDPQLRAEHDTWIKEQENLSQRKTSTEQTNQEHTHRKEQESQSFYQDNHSENVSKETNDEDKSHWLGRVLIPTIVIVLISRILAIIGFSLGFFGFIACFAVYGLCHHITYKKINSHKFIKECVAIITGLAGLILTLFMVMTILDNTNKSKSSNENNQIPQTSYQNSQPSNQTSDVNDTQTVNPVNVAPVNNTQLNLQQARQAYDDAVININQVWNSLNPNTQDFLRAEQKAINKKREADCTSYGNAQSSDKNIAKAYRYLCEVPQLNERMEYLKTQLNKEVTTTYIPSKNEVVLSGMMRIYHNPELAPSIQVCQGDVYCNAFSALAQHWVDISDDYRFKNTYNIKYDAEIGDGYGLNKGFTLTQEKSIFLSEAGNLAYYNSGKENSAKEKIFAEGLAVLLFIEDMNGWQ